MDGFSRRPQPSRRPDAPNSYFPDLSEPVGTPSPAPEAFITPETAAAQDAVASSSPAPEVSIEFDNEPGQNSDANTKPPKQPRRSFKAWFGSLSKGKKILFVTAIILILGGGGFAAYALTRPADEPQPKPVQQATEPEPTTVANTLTGREVDPAVNQIPVTAVMIENSREARPQSGLADAGVVFEAIAEGGITRYLALYQDTSPESIGPVRSVRPYYVDWAFAFNPSIAHVGGSPEALQLIRNIGMQDIDQGANPGSYTRTTDRYAPHNVYTSFARLQDLQKNKGFTSSEFTGFARKEATPSPTPNASTVNVAISSQFYNSNYTYDAASNTYLRSLAGTPHKDEKTGKQIAPSSLVVMTMPYSIQSDGIHSQYGTIGSGEVQIFQDGVVTKGTWHKASREAQITFKDANGQTIGLNPGQTWLAVVNTSSKVTYQ